MRRLGFLVGCASIVVALTGCPPTYPNCNSDEHCAEQGQVCVQGQCQECADDGNCKPGFVCQGAKCVPKPECTSDQGCGPDRKCQGGKCVVHECDEPADCKGGRCENNRCVEGCTADTDCPSGQRCEAGQCVTGGDTTAADQCTWEPVRFEFNAANLSAEAQGQLKQVADCIRQQNARVTLQGHADERGTEEYNLQLSNRRAESVKKYLVTLGVAEGQLDTVGFGENRPEATGSNEDAWAQNRRVEFVPR